MNLILLSSTQQSSETTYQLNDRQVQHVENILKKQDGDSIRVGILNQGIGQGVYRRDAGSVTIHNELLSPPPVLPCTLVLALPRPNMLKRTLMNVTAMGVKEIHLIHSSKVEKSYWQSPVLQPQSLHEFLIEGLEQAKDTSLPNLHLHPRFRPFVEDSLPDLLLERTGLVAHPYQAQACPVALATPSLLAIGPEGGWNDFEVESFTQAGMACVHLGPRILKVETAVPVLLPRLHPAL